MLRDSGKETSLHSYSEVHVSSHGGLWPIAAVTVLEAGMRSFLILQSSGLLPQVSAGRPTSGGFLGVSPSPNGIFSPLL